jgi:hypothetical protein
MPVTIKPDIGHVIVGWKSAIRHEKVSLLVVVNAPPVSATPSR